MPETWLIPFLLLLILLALSTMLWSLGRLREDVALWKSRWEAEREAHEQTIKHYEEMEKRDAGFAPF